MNTNGGNLFIGINDDGVPVGLTNLDSIQLQIKNRIGVNISPSTLGLYDINIKELDEKNSSI